MEEKRTNTAVTAPTDTNNSGELANGVVTPAPVVYGLPEYEHKPDLSLEVAEENKPKTNRDTEPIISNTKKLRKLTRSKTMIVSAVITLIVTAITGATILILARQGSESRNTTAPNTLSQELTILNADSKELPIELFGPNKSLVVNGTVNLNGDVTVSGVLTISEDCTTFLNGGSLTTNALGQVICVNDESSGAGSSVTTAGGTTGVIPMFTAADQIGDSIISQALGTISIAGNLNLSGGLTVTGTADINTTGIATTSIGNGTGNLTLAGANILLNSANLTRSASGVTTIDLVDVANTTLALANSGTGVANLTVDGSGIFATGLTVSAGGATVASGDLNLTAGNLTTAGIQRLSNAGALSNITGYLQGSGAFAFSGGGNFSLDSAAFDVTTAGALSGITTLNMSGNFTQTGASTLSTGTGAISLSGNTTVALDKTLSVNGISTLRPGSADGVGFLVQNAAGDKTLLSVDTNYIAYANALVTPANDLENGTTGGWQRLAGRTNNLTGCSGVPDWTGIGVIVGYTNAVQASIDQLACSAAPVSGATYTVSFTAAYTGSATNSTFTFGGNTQAYASGANSFSLTTSSTGTLTFNKTSCGSACSVRFSNISVIATSSSIASDNINFQAGAFSLRVNTVNASGDGAEYPLVIAPNTRYVLTIWARSSTNNTTYLQDLSIGYRSNFFNSTQDCFTNKFLNGGTNVFGSQNWTKFTCAFTTDAFGGNSIYVRRTATGSDGNSFFIDSINLYTPAGSTVMLGQTNSVPGSAALAKLTFAGDGGSNSTTTIQPLLGSGTNASFVLILPAESGVICTTAVTSDCSVGNDGKYLNKVSADTASVKVNNASNLYRFTNASTGGTGGLLYLDNGTNIGSALVVRSAVDYVSEPDTLFFNTSRSFGGTTSPLKVYVSGKIGISTGSAEPSTSLTDFGDLSFGRLTAGRLINVLKATSAGVSGGALTVAAGMSNGAAAGGTLNLQGGATDNDVNASGGAVNVLGGTASAGTTGTGTGGAVTVRAGTSGVFSGNGGLLTLQGGTGTGDNAVSNGGNVTIAGGTAGQYEGSVGGSVSIAGANGTSTETGAAGSAVSINGGNAAGNSTVDRVGGAINLTGGTSVRLAAGGAINLQGGAGSSTNNATGSIGGAINITAGNGGSTAGGTGGQLNLNGGSAIAGNFAGGRVVLSGGASNGTGAGGRVTVQGGSVDINVTANGGAVEFLGGSASTGTSGNGVGGAVTVRGGNGGARSGAGGQLTLQGGTAIASQVASAGGNVVIVGGTAAPYVGSTGGSVSISGANGTSTGNGAAGSDVNINGGAAGGTGDNAGGDINITAGISTGTALAGTITLQGGASANFGNAAGGAVNIYGGTADGTGNGGLLTLRGGNAESIGLGNANGGDVTITPGAKRGTGIYGTITVGDGTGAVVINSTNFVVDAAGAVSGVTGYAQASGNFLQSGAGTFGTGTGAVSLNGATTLISSFSQTGANTFSTGTGAISLNGATTLVSSFSQTGADTFSTGTGAISLNGNVTVAGGSSITINSDIFTDLTGTGLQVSGGELQTTLGTTVDLTSEITGILPVLNGGTGASDTATARSNLSAAQSGANADVTSTTALTTITGLTTINPTSALTIGNTGQSLTLQGNGSTTLSATASGFTASLGFATPTSSYTITLPNAGGPDTVCLLSLGNCAGAGAGVTAPTPGTVNRVAKFTAGQTIGDSSISDNGTTVSILGSGGLAVGVASTINGQVVFNNSTNGNTVTLQSGVTGGTNPVFTLPTADGSANQCLKTDGFGVLSFVNCVGGGGGGSGVTDLNAFTNSISIVGTLNQLNVNNSSNVITLSTPQSIATTSNVTFNNITANGSLLQSGSGTFGTGTGAVSLNGPTSVTTTNTFNVGSGTSTFAGGNITQTGSGTFGTGTGAVSLNGATTISSTLVVQGANALTLGTASANTGAILFRGSGSADTLTLIGPSAPSANTLTLPNETGTLCTTGSVCSGYAPATGGTGYIRNGTTTQTSANFNIQSSAAGSIGGIIQGAAFQSANLFQINNSSGNIMAHVDSLGNIVSSTSVIGQSSVRGGLSILSTGSLNFDFNNTSEAIISSGGYMSSLRLLSGEAFCWHSCVPAGDLTLQTGGGGGASSGGNIFLNVGVSSGSSAGGVISLTSGTGGEIDGVGGALNLLGGNGGGGNSTGGAVIIQGGTKTGSGTEGVINIGTTAAGSINIGKTGVTTTNTGALTVTQAFTANNGASINRTLTVNSGSTQNVGLITFNSPADTSGTNISNGLNITPTIGNAIAGTNTANIINIAALTGDAQVTLNAINIGNLTPTAAAEMAIRVGTGWDTILGGTTAGTNLIGFTNFTVTTAGAITGTSLGVGAGNITTTGILYGNFHDRSTAGPLNIGTGGASAATSITLGSASVTGMIFTTDNNAANDFQFTGGATFNSSATFNTNVYYDFTSGENIDISALTGSSTTGVIAIDTTPTSAPGTTRGIYIRQINQAAHNNGLDNVIEVDNGEAVAAIASVLTVTSSGAGGFTNIFDILGVQLNATELGLLDGRDTQLVDTTDVVATAIIGTGALNSGSITNGFGAINVGSSNITTTGTVFGNLHDRSTAGPLNIGTGGASAATSITLGSASVTGMIFTTDNNAANDFQFTGGATFDRGITIAAGQNITGAGALNITPGGALVVGATSRTATLQGSTTTITSTGALNIGANAIAQTIQIGNTTGVVAQIINLGNNTTAGSTSAVTIGSNITGSTTTIRGNITNIGATATSSSTINIANTIDATGIQVVSIGSTANASNTTTLQGGTGVSAVRILTGAGGTIGIGNSAVANTIQIGNTTGAVAQTINIGNNATASSTSAVTIGNLLSTSATTIQGGTGGVKVVATTGGVELISGATSWTAISDRTAKDNLVVIENALAKIDQLTGYNYNYLAGFGDPTIKHNGLIAQDVQAVLPDAVVALSNGKLGIQYDQINSLAINGIKELNNKVNALSTTVLSMNNLQSSQTLTNLLVSDTIETNNLIVTGTATVNNLVVTGGATLASLQVSGVITTQTLTVAGATTLAVLKVSGVAEFADDIRLTGAVNTRQAITKKFKASGSITAGQVVVLDTTQDGYVTTTTTAGDTKIIGVVVQTVTNAGDDIEVAIGGSVQVQFDTTTPVTPGDLITTGTSGGKATTATTPLVGSVLGKATSSKNANNLAWILILMN